MTFVQVTEHNPSNQKQKGTRTLFSRHGLYPRLQAIKLLASLTYPLKRTKGQPTPHPITSHDLVLIDIRHNVGLGGVCGCEWCLKLQHLMLLLKGGNHYFPLLELEFLLLIGVLTVYDRMGVTVHLLTSDV
jgi:hypothetical protein